MQTYSDLTIRLDELYVNGAFSEFTPDVTESAKEVRAASPKNINERGGFYLSQIEIPMNFASDDFGANAGADFGDAGKISYLKQSVTALKRMSSVKWQDEVDVQSKNPALLQKPGKSVREKMQLIAGHLSAYAVSWSRELWGNRTNELARVSAIDTTNKIVTCANAGNTFGVFNLNIGQNVRIYAGDGTPRVGGSIFLTVTSVNPSNRTFSYAQTAGHPEVQVAPTGVIDGDIIYPSQGQTSLKDKALAGIDYLLGAGGAFQGTADRTVNQYLMGTRINAGGSTVSAAFLRRMKSEQKYRVKGKRTKGKFYASAQYDGYEATELGKQSFMQTGDTLRKGFRKLFFDDSMFENDMYIPRDAVVYADLSQIDRFELTPYGPVKNDGNYELPVPSNTGGTYQDNLMVRFRGYEQLGCEVPAKLGVWASGFSTAGLATGYTS